MQALRQKTGNELIHLHAVQARPLVGSKAVVQNAAPGITDHPLGITCHRKWMASKGTTGSTVLRSVLVQAGVPDFSESIVKATDAGSC